MSDERKEIIYESRCELCDEHKTDLGTLISIYKSIKANFSELASFDQLELAKCMYEQHKLDQRTKMIQDFKKVNIKAINK